MTGIDFDQNGNPYENELHWFSLARQCACAQFDTICFDVVFPFLMQVGFKMFLGVTASVTNWDAEGTCCNIVLEDNPLVDFVELPDTCQGLYYCNILSGVIRGALEMVSFCYYVAPF